MPYVLMPTNNEQKSEIEEFAESFNIPMQDADTNYIRRRFQEKRKELEYEMSKTMQKRKERFMKEVGKIPAKCEIIIQPHRFVLLIFDKDENKMDLKENGELQCLKAVWMHIVKNFVEYTRSKGINDVRTAVYLK